MAQPQQRQIRAESANYTAHGNARSLTYRARGQGSNPSPHGYWLDLFPLCHNGNSILNFSEAQLGMYHFFAKTAATAKSLPCVTFRTKSHTTQTAFPMISPTRCHSSRLYWCYQFIGNFVSLLVALWCLILVPPILAFILDLPVDIVQCILAAKSIFLQFAENWSYKLCGMEKWRKTTQKCLHLLPDVIN